MRVRKPPRAARVPAPAPRQRDRTQQQARPPQSRPSGPSARSPPTSAPTLLLLAALSARHPPPPYRSFLTRLALLRATSTATTTATTMPHLEPKLPVKTPAPSDIDIAQSVEPVHIAQIAEAAGLQPDEYDLYGTYKAKVRRGTTCCCSTATCAQCCGSDVFGPGCGRHMGGSTYPQSGAVTGVVGSRGGDEGCGGQGGVGWWVGPSGPGAC